MCRNTIAQESRCWVGEKKKTRPDLHLGPRFVARVMLERGFYCRVVVRALFRKRHYCKVIFGGVFIWECCLLARSVYYKLYQLLL